LNNKWKAIFFGAVYSDSEAHRRLAGVRGSPVDRIF